MAKQFENNMEECFSTSKGVFYLKSLSLEDNGSVSQVIKKRIEAINDENQESEEGDAFFVADIGVIKRQHKKWKTVLPRIEPFYAVKSNPEPLVLKTLANLGTGFDCASKDEIQRILDLSVDPSRIVFAQTTKQISFLRHAQKHKVKLMTFDNEDELYKIKHKYPGAELLLRIQTDKIKGSVNFGMKFGASLDSTKPLLQLAKALGLNIIGVSYHAGCLIAEPRAYRDALEHARSVFDEAKELGYDMNLVDVGGGFPATMEAGITFEVIASRLSQAVDDMFPKDVRVIAEPGRFYSTNAFTLCTQIISRRVVSTEGDSDPTFMYYINDGIFGSFRTLDFGYIHPVLKVLRKNQEIQDDWSGEKVYTSSIWGPTCSPDDFVAKETKLPKLESGDWIIWEKMGSYTSPASSEFNGIPKPKVYFTET
ncbi:hypothetical protein INT43_006410 [Umbelopsis isabellina]|uniref:ornithine decarboxylase n=1 Tax=Mortierella isabellina TaxID=91625 RepID=A0A8H7PZ58_MORIS|nr:hypothetical protein INT43_006410 [Umbelopsis isabellina]